jgi:Flp pilus assembly protein TadG
MGRLRRGQIAVLTALVLPTLLGSVALGTDVSIHYYNWVQL